MPYLAELETLLLLLLSLYMVILWLEATNYFRNAEHSQMHVTGRVQYIVGGSMLFSIVAGMCM